MLLGTNSSTLFLPLILLTRTASLPVTFANYLSVLLLKMRRVFSLFVFLSSTGTVMISDFACDLSVQEWLFVSRVIVCAVYSVLLKRTHASPSHSHLL